MPFNETEISNNNRSTKPCHRLKLDESLIYYGLYPSNCPNESVDLFLNDLNESFTSSRSNDLAAIKAEKCLTVYEKGQVFCVYFKSKSKACEWFMNLTGRINLSSENSDQQASESFVDSILKKITRK